MSDTSLDSILLETVYSRPELDIVDSLFQKILDEITTKSTNFESSTMKKSCEKIALLIGKIFNFNCKIFIDNTMKNYVTYGMAVYPSYEEMKGQIADALEDKKKGFQLISCNNVSIELDTAFLKYAKKVNLTGRHLTAVMLHEIGHKVFVKSQCDIRQGGEDENNATAVIGFLGMSLMIPLAAVNAIASISMIVLCYILMSNFITASSIKTYSKSEGLSDSLPVKYGYGAEIYQVMKVLEEEENVNKSNSKIKFVNNIKKNFNFFYLRRKYIIEVVQKELSEITSPSQKKILSKILDDLQETQKKDYVEESTNLDDLL